MQEQERVRGVSCAPADFVRAGPRDDSQRQAHHQVFPQQPDELACHPARIAAVQQTGRSRLFQQASQRGKAGLTSTAMLTRLRKTEREIATPVPLTVIAPLEQRERVDNEAGHEIGQPVVGEIQPKGVACAHTPRSTSSIRTMGAPSPFRGPSFRIRV